MSIDRSLLSFTTILFCLFITNSAFAAAPPINNDPYISPMPVNLDGVAYPSGTCVSQSLVGTAAGFIGYSAIVLPTGGQDRWYSFVATSPGIRITVNAPAMDVVMELRQDNGTLLYWEDDLVGAGEERLAFGGLVAGFTYRLGVRSYDGTLDNYTVCFQPLLESKPADGSGTFDICTNLKAKWTGASLYGYNFFPTGITPGSASIAYSNTQIPLSNNSLDLQHNGTYEVLIDAIYNFYDGANNFESVFVGGTEITTIAITHADVQVKSSQRCPTSLLPGTYLQGKPFVCNAVNFTVEFTKVSDCLGSSDLDAPFTVNTSGAASQLRLNFSSPQSLAPNSYYRVRWRPNFSYGSGDFGTPRIIYMAASNSELALSESDEMSTMQMDIYPNPADGSAISLWIEAAESNTTRLQIFDLAGKLVHSEQLMTVYDGAYPVEFTTPLPEGLYIVELAGESKTVSKKLIIAN